MQTNDGTEPCPTCHSGVPLGTIKLHAEINTLRRDVERLTSERDEAEKREQWARSEVHELRSERDAAYAASVRSDEVHAEAMRAVRARAEKAEAERDALWDERAWLYNITTAAIPEEHREHVDGILRAERERLDKLRTDLTAARAQVERLRGALQHITRVELFAEDTREALNTAIEDARAALADAKEGETR